jgi:hypothetical protein
VMAQSLPYRQSTVPENASFWVYLKGCEHMRA